MNSVEKWKYSKDKNGNIYGENVAFPTSRVAWLSLVEKRVDNRPVEPGKRAPDPKFECTVLLRKGDPAVEEIVSELRAQINFLLEIFNGDKPTGISLRKFPMDGDDYLASKPQNAEKYPYYVGCYVIQAKNSQDIDVVGRNAKPCDRAAIEGGMLCNVVVSPMITNYGLSIKLRVVQFVKDDGTRFGSFTANSALGMVSACEDDGKDLPPAAQGIQPIEDEPTVGQAYDKAVSGTAPAAPLAGTVVGTPPNIGGSVAANPATTPQGAPAVVGVVQPSPITKPAAQTGLKASISIL